jgi:lipopolysaccharide heptosyltransferase I
VQFAEVLPIESLSSTRNHSRILLIKPSSLGDIVHAFPVVSALKAQWPGAHLTWVVKRQWVELVERAEGVDRVWPVEGTVGSWLGQAQALRAERFDLAVDLQGLFRSGALARWSGAPMRIGFANGREGSPWFYTQRVEAPTTEMHAVDRYLLVAAALGVRVQGLPQFRFKIFDADRAEVRALFRHKGVALDQPWIAMNVSARWSTKRWSLGSFAAVLDRLHQEGLGPVVVIGSAGDRHDAEQLRALTNSPFLDLTGAVSLGVLPALLSKAAVMITNDSGPMHIAAALGVPVAAIFGPTSAVRTGPYGAGHRVLTASIPCRPCFSRVCRHSPEMECLHLVTPNDVAEATKRLVVAYAGFS